MSSINVLVVDDSQTVREVIVKTLNVAGLELREVFQAENGKQALETMEDKWVDLVISDINMPVMNGIELVERMQEHDIIKTIPVVIVTTEGSQKRITHLAEKGVKAYLRKPFSPEQIREIVDGILEGKNAGAQHCAELGEVFPEVAEKMAFMFAENVEDDEFPDEVGDPVEARISFVGPSKGVITMAVSKSMCPVLAANTLGIDAADEGAAEKGLDSLKELLNVVCGNVLTRIAGDEPVFELSIPELHDIDGMEWQNLRKRSGALTFMLDDYPVILQISMS